MQSREKMDAGHVPFPCERAGISEKVGASEVQCARPMWADGTGQVTLVRQVIWETVVVW